MKKHIYIIPTTQIIILFNRNTRFEHFRPTNIAISDPRPDRTNERK